MSGLSLFMSNYLFSLEGPDRLVGVGLNITDDKEEKCENVCQSYRRSGRPGRLCTHTHIFWSPYAVPVLSDHSGVLCNIFSSPSPACVSAKLSGTSEPVPPEFLW